MLVVQLKGRNCRIFVPFYVWCSGRKSNTYCLGLSVEIYPHKKTNTVTVLRNGLFQWSHKANAKTRFELKDNDEHRCDFYTKVLFQALLSQSLHATKLKLGGSRSRYCCLGVDDNSSQLSFDRHLYKTTYIHTYIHTYNLFMLEIYRVAVELMYSRK